MTTLNPKVAHITRRIHERSAPVRTRYLRRVQEAGERGPRRTHLSCTNLAHGFAACPAADKQALRGHEVPCLGIVSAYNDMLSAHQPLGDYPELIKRSAREFGAVAQFAGGVPAMCDGITQGQPGMELSLFSRDVIAMATAVALSHDMFDAAVCLGVCDKIVPGLLIGALTFGHLPVVFIPAGPMPSGLPNEEKARIRQLHAEGKVGREELLDAEARSYHSPGTCTFYGTANSNQMLMEVMGLHLPGSAFVNPDTPLREALTAAAARQALAITRLAGEYTPVAHVIDERAIVNGIVALLASGGSTNHTMHLVAIARAAGIVIDWNDFDTLSAVVPLLARVYPNGSADVNQFHAAGGTALLIRELLDAGLLHADVHTVAGPGLARYAREPALEAGTLRWHDAPAQSRDLSILRPVSDPFDTEGGLRLLQGNLGRAVIKTSAVRAEHRRVDAPARIFHDQQAVLAAFRAGELDRDVVVVVRFQGPQANGMPELHKLTPALSVVQNRGYRVALVTDGRMSGASGKVPAAIHVSPEAGVGGPLARLRDGDRIVLDAGRGRLDVHVPEAEWAAREPVCADLEGYHHGLGRELFAGMRHLAGGAETGAVTWFPPRS